MRRGKTCPAFLERARRRFHWSRISNDNDDGVTETVAYLSSQAPPNFYVGPRLTRVSGNYFAVPSANREQVQAFDTNALQLDPDL